VTRFNPKVSKTLAWCNLMEAAEIHSVIVVLGDNCEKYTLNTYIYIYNFHSEPEIILHFRTYSITVSLPTFKLSQIHEEKQ
jgi:hypothetical protein